MNDKAIANLIEQAWRQAFKPLYHRESISTAQPKRRRKK